jgi:uracil-DNA glycosylase
MKGTPVHGPAIDTRVLLVGQAPGAHEASLGRPFAYTAGKALMRWFSDACGVDETLFRERVYIAAIARCFPGQAIQGKGDRIPSPLEIENCRRHLSSEVAVLKPDLVIAVGKVAIAEVLGPDQFGKSAKLTDVVGRVIPARFHRQCVEVIALPHPSGLSVWPRVEPGRTLLAQALNAIAKHPAWCDTMKLQGSSSR